MQWREVDGYDWCVIETPETGPYLSLVLGYGLVHEPLEHFGTLQLAAGMLQSELSRPVETGLGRASVPEVSVTVGADATFLNMRGDVPTLLAAWQRLADILAGRQPLDIAAPVDVNISAAPRDLTSRFGLTSLTLAASQVIEPQSAGDPFVLLGHLNPSAGNVRAVMCTNTQELVSGVFASPSGVPGPEHSRYRNDARPGGMEFRAGYPMMSVMVPSSDDGAAAVRVLAQQTVQHIHEVTRRELGIEVSLVSVGPEMLATFMVVDTILYGEQRSQIQHLIAAKPIPDHRITEAVEFEVGNRPLNRMLARRVHGLDDDMASLDATHQALGQARATMRFYSDQYSQLPAGYEPLTRELPSPQGPKFKGKGGRDTLVIGSDVIERRRDGGRGVASALDRVDVSNLALIIDDPTDCLVLIDDQYRTVDIIFDVYRNQSELRELIAQRTVGVPRIISSNVVPAQQVREQVGRSRMMKWAVGLAPVAVILFAVLMSWADDLGAVGEAAPEHRDPAQVEASEEPERTANTVETVVGETATMPNWSRVTVKNVAQYEPRDDNPFAQHSGLHLMAEVEYCAAENADSVSPDEFQMFYGDPAQTAHDIEAIDDRLTARELAAGQCATGNLGFFMIHDEAPGLRISYSNYPNSLTWAVEEIE